MIRQDKITFLISTLQVYEEYKFIDCDYTVHNNIFDVSDYSDKIFKRIGILSRFENNTSKILTKYLPVNKHDFIKKALRKFSNDYCLDHNPFCSNCFFIQCCDYYNKKNDWSE